MLIRELLQTFIICLNFHTIGNIIIVTVQFILYTVLSNHQIKLRGGSA